MIYDELPIFKLALDYVVYIENIVKGFDKYHKYTIGLDLRENAKSILFLIHRANITKNRRVVLLEELRDSCENGKMLIRVAKELQAFHPFTNLSRVQN